MSVWKKCTALLAAVSLCAGLLAGCGKNDAPSVSTAQGVITAFRPTGRAGCVITASIL